MTIAIAATGRDLESETAARGARAPYYLLFDRKGNLLEAMENPYAGIERGAAPEVASMLAARGVEILAAGNFGQRFLSDLNEQGIAHVQRTGRISDIVREFVG
jgi:predicted Fe-Mo cluster-binding NifX family protein